MVKKEKKRASGVLGEFRIIRRSKPRKGQEYSDDDSLLIPVRLGRFGRSMLLNLRDLLK